MRQFGLDRIAKMPNSMSPLPVKQELNRNFVNRHLFQRQGTFIVANAAISAGDVTITTNDTTGFSVGDGIFINEGTTEECDIFQITAVVVNTSITVTRPICNDYTTAATIEKIADNMAVNATQASPSVFEISPPSDQKWNLLRIIIYMETSSTPILSDLGDITNGVTNGVILRFNPGDASTFKTLAQWKQNSDIKQDMYDLELTSASGASGQAGLTGRWTFEKFAYGMELNGALGDKFEVVIQDNLSSIDEFEIKVQGHINEG